MPVATSKRPTLRKDKAYVLRLAKEHDVRFIRLWFTDILGFLKSFAITIDELEKARESFVQLSLFEESFLQEKEADLNKLQAEVKFLQCDLAVLHIDVSDHITNLVIGLQIL